MSDFNDFGFSTVSADEYEAQQTKTVDTAKEVVSTATASMKPELEKIESKISGLTDSMRVLSDEMADRKEELNDKWSSRMNEVEDLILPLLQNLAKDGDKREWIKWPNRTDILNKQIDEINLNLRINGKDANLHGKGNGPIDSFINALSNKFKFNLKVSDYQQNAISSGSDASAAAYIELYIKDRTFWGVGINSNTVVASFQAIINGINRSGY